MRPIAREDIVVDDAGYIFVDGVKVGRRYRSKEGDYYIEFIDKDKRRSRKRGGRDLPVNWVDFVEAVVMGMEEQ